MRTFQKISKALIFVAAVVLFFKADALAATKEYTNPDTGYGVYMDDAANLLSASEEEALINDMKPITAYGDVAFVSTNDCPYSSTSEYARQYYYNIFQEGSGTIFYIDMDNRNIYIFSHGAIYKTVTNGKANTITDNVYTYASDANYYKCASEAYSQIVTILDGGKIAEPMKIISNALFALLAALLINYFIVVRMSNVKTTGYQEMAEAAFVHAKASRPNAVKTSITKRYNPHTESSGGSSGGGGGGGCSGGGGGGHSF